MKLVVDIETNSLDVDQAKIWCIVAKDIDNGKIYEFVEETLHDGSFCELCLRADRIYGHNFIAYDHCVLDKFFPNYIDQSKIVDTLILSKLLKYKLADGEGHSLEAWGSRFGLLKKGLSLDFTKYSPEILERCKQDVEINHRLYEYLRKYLDKPEFRTAMDTEMVMAWVCLDMHKNGFKYDKQRADILLGELSQRQEELDAVILRSFPAKAKPIREITPRLTKHGTISRSNLPREWSDYTKLHAGCPFTLVEWVAFNPGSPSQIVERLDEAGWKPTVKTKSGKGFKVCEENLATLPENAPEGTKKLVERLLLSARIRTLNEWHSYYNERTGRIHGTFDSIGTWPGRMAHRRPNLGNVSAAKSIKYKGQYLKNLAIDLGTRMRGFWTCDDDAWLVGTDMEAAHVRLFAHYIDDKEFTKAVASGDKKKGTDVHTVGSKIFQHLGCDRDNHKTFIFSFFNGAGAAKVAEIFGCSLEDAKKALKLYQERYPGLARLRQELIPKYAAQGWFPGLDGRQVFYGEEHGMFAGMLQSGEAIVMKMANLQWRKELDKKDLERDVRYRQVNLVHDEFVTEVRGTKEIADYVGSIQADAIRIVGQQLRLRCSLAGEYKIGKDWLSIH